MKRGDNFTFERYGETVHATCIGVKRGKSNMKVFQCNRWLVKQTEWIDVRFSIDGKEGTYLEELEHLQKRNLIIK